MGTAIADWAYYLGYSVVAISTIQLERPYQIININSACEMLDELKKQDFN